MKTMTNGVESSLRRRQRTPLRLCGGWIYADGRLGLNPLDADGTVLGVFEAQNET